MHVGNKKLWVFDNADNNSDLSYQIGELSKSDMSREFTSIMGTSTNWFKKFNNLLIGTAQPICSANEIYSE
jgi:hypothetical protein